MPLLLFFSVRSLIFFIYVYEQCVYLCVYTNAHMYTCMCVDGTTCVEVRRQLSGIW